MRLLGKTGVVAALVGSMALAGCGEDTSGTVAVDHGKDQNLMKAMGGYMEKRQGTKGKSKSKAEPKAEAASEPGPESKP
ncbi:hypothetical protein [Planctomyces sp. SH-PL62]|uniref:hypothetical protein n=1 Tax=Planctomyces sp. SH-PL62 TaxID=1636152 RepID=UPI00078B88F0|nr:hypothetical protein [Planctomyces sp. SH-PL62]AMV37559.1 hypothetical protein VT85_08990 [Planctomyces sp. SH-PL62]